MHRWEYEILTRNLAYENLLIHVTHSLLLSSSCCLFNNSHLNTRPQLPLLSRNKIKAIYIFSDEKSGILSGGLSCVF